MVTPITQALKNVSLHLQKSTQSGESTQMMTSLATTHYAFKEMLYISVASMISGTCQYSTQE